MIDEWWTETDLEGSGRFEMRYRRMMEEINWTDRVRNEETLQESSAEISYIQ